MKRSDNINTTSKKYKITPLFWKTIVFIAFLSFVASFMVMNDYLPSPSVANASDPAALEEDATNTSSDDLTASETPVAEPIVEPVIVSEPAVATASAFIPKISDEYNLFATSAVIGDSRSEGLMLYSGIKEATDYAIKGLNLKSVFSNKFIYTPNGGKTTILEDMKLRTFDKVFISFGLNELGWSSKLYIDKYAELINAIRQSQPDAKIYIQSTFPINPDKCKFNAEQNQRILVMNQLLEELASSMENVYYLDLTGPFTGDNNAIIDAASSDGIHLNKKHCIIWFNHIKEKLKQMELPIYQISMAGIDGTEMVGQQIEVQAK